MKCPVCSGRGELPDPRKIPRDRKSERMAMARVLRDAGYSFRQIADQLGYKSPRSVQRLFA